MTLNSATVILTMTYLAALVAGLPADANRPANRSDDGRAQRHQFQRSLCRSDQNGLFNSSNGMCQCGCFNRQCTWLCETSNGGDGQSAIVDATLGEPCRADQIGLSNPEGRQLQCICEADHCTWLKYAVEDDLDNYYVDSGGKVVLLHGTACPADKSDTFHPVNGVCRCLCRRTHCTWICGG